MNEENLSYVLPQVIDNVEKLKKELRMTKYLLYFVAGIVISGLILKIIAG